jgi:hypothetical protein
MFLQNTGNTTIRLHSMATQMTTVKILTYVLPLMWETKFHTHTKQWVISFVYFSFMFLDSGQKYKRFSTAF